jgi:ankyrin repeat protein
MGNTALQFAAMSGHTEIVELLLENGADKSLKDNRGMTALQQAEMKGDREIIELLK